MHFTIKLRQIGGEHPEFAEIVRRQHDQLVRAEIQKEHLMAFIVHDLKNPVNTIDIHAQLLLRDKLLPTSAQSTVTQIRTGTRQLTCLITNILDIFKSQEGQLVPHHSSVELLDLARDVLHDMEVTASGRGLGLTFCKLAAEVHGGKIWVEDAAPGAVFCVSIPRGDEVGSAREDGCADHG